MKNLILALFAFALTQNLIAQINPSDIQAVVEENTNYEALDSIAKLYNYQPGDRLRVKTKFSFHEDGKINILLVWGPDKFLEEEAVKILNKIQLKPSQVKYTDIGEPITYAWPIVFEIENESQKKARIRKEKRKAKRKLKQQENNSEETKLK